MNNITTAVFDPGSRYARTSGLWQYDYGQILRIQGLKLPSAVEIHFSLDDKGGTSVSRIGTSKDGVTDVVIPDSMLENGIGQNYNIYAFVYLADETSGNTEYCIKIPVKARPKPEVLPASGETSLEAIIKTINEIADGKADTLDYKNSVLSLMAGGKTLSSVTIHGGSGTDAREIELQKSDTAIQWRYKGDAGWTDLVLLEDISGPQGEPGVTDVQINGQSIVENGVAEIPVALSRNGPGLLELGKGYDLLKYSDSLKNIQYKLQAKTI